MTETVTYQATDVPVQWGITNETADIVRRALVAHIDHIEDRCAEWGCMCDLNGMDCAKSAKDALHEFDSGLHQLVSPSPAGTP